MTSQLASWQSTELTGGLPLVWQRRPGPEIVASRLWIRGGSSADLPGQRGAAQLLAGLMTRGCGDYGAEALADLVEGCGAALRCEAMVRRGEISRRDQASLVVRSVWSAMQQGAAVGLVLGLVLLVFPWLSLPMTLAGLVGAGKASVDLFHAFWDGLDTTQRAELHDAAYRAGMNLGRLVHRAGEALPEG